MAASKPQKKKLVKYLNIKIGQRFLVHILFKVSSIGVCLCNYSNLFSVVIKLTAMSTATIVTGGIISVWS